jgi:signal peptidase I
MNSELKEWIKDIVIALIIAVVVIQFVKPTIVKESSMEPNFYENDYLFVSKQSYKLFGEVERGDVVVVHSSLVQENGDEKMLIKRIIGLPGDRIDISDGMVYINGEALEESYTKDGVTSGDVRNLVVPDGEIFCMGDNRLVSIDSRDPSVGCIDIDQIVGKVVLRLYPFNKIGIIRNPYDA